jgi:hypothetical protein
VSGLRGKRVKELGLSTRACGNDINLACAVLEVCIIIMFP